MAPGVQTPPAAFPGACAGDPVAPALQPSGAMAEGRPRELEYRYVVDRGAAEGVLRRAASHLAPQIHDPDRPVAWCRTLYLDTEDGAFLKTFRDGATTCRVRIRQYAAATDLASPAHISGGAAWLELKRSWGIERDKVRVELDAGDVDRVLVGEVPSPETIARLEGTPLLAGVVAGMAAGRIRPRLLTWYRRWSLGGPALRITLDEAIAYCMPEPMVASGQAAEPRSVVAREALTVLELKLAGLTPAWLQADIDRIGGHQAHRHSKFRAGMEALRNSRNARELRQVG
jgi:hypothetical protein